MKRIAIALLTLPLAIALFGQSMPSVTADFSQANLQEVIRNFEAQTEHTFYYEPSWMDSLYFSGSFDNSPLNKALTAVFENSTLDYFIQEKNVYLTRDVRILAEPTILKALHRDEEVEAVEFEKGLLFAREYLDQSNDETDYENFVFEIGNRKNLVAGGKSTIAGYIKERGTGEPLSGAVVYTGDPIIATSTDPNGFYSLTIPNGKSTLIVQYVGMKSTRRKVVLFSNGQLNIEMEVDVIALQEVTVESERDVNIQNVQMGVSRLNVQETKNVPIVLGEKDIMKIATTFAGVQSIGEGASGFNVRGGKSDQNLVILNDATVYNASHFFGFFSVFNSDAIHDMEIYKSSIPARFGGRLSSVFDIESKESNRDEFTGYGGISPITSKLTVEIPLFDKKAGLMLAGRSTYSNWILKRVGNADFRQNRVSFSDFIMRYDHDLSDKDKLIVSGYYSKDDFRLSSDTLFSFSDFTFVNANASARWIREINTNMTSSISGIYSYYNYELNYDESEPNAFVQDFGINEATLKGDLNYYIDNTHSLAAGIELKHIAINPGSKKPFGKASVVSPFAIEEERGLQSSVYVSDEYNLSEDITLYGGLRYSMFSTFGKQTVYSYDQGAPKNNDTRQDSVVYGAGEHIKTYHGPELRLSARYKLDNSSSLKAGYNRTRQYVHTLSNSASLSPTDTWRLSNQHLLPQIADQYSLGYYRNFLGNKFETSVEVYYKDLQNLLDFKVGSQFLLNPNIETVALQGPGKSYGVEVSVKKSGKLNGWVNYAYARTFIRLDGNSPEEIVNEGRFFPSNYDIPHTINLVANYKLTHRISLSYNFTFNSGRPVTYPVGSYDFKGIQTVHYTDRNAYRIPHYMRMDFGVNLEAGHKLDKLAYSYWSFSVYNMLGRDNPFSVFFDIRDGEVQGYQLIVFGNPIPTLSYNFKF
ncbi:MAG: TonB-dependent receptor [Cyclobacteriaceae bacterium]